MMRKRNRSTECLYGGPDPTRRRAEAGLPRRPCAIRGRERTSKVVDLAAYMQRRAKRRRSAEEGSGAGEPPEQFCTCRMPPGVKRAEDVLAFTTHTGGSIAVAVATERPRRGQMAAVELADGRAYVGRYYSERDGGGRFEWGERVRA